MKGEKNMRKWKKGLCAVLSMIMIGSSCIPLTSEAKEWKDMETRGEFVNSEVSMLSGSDQYTTLDYEKIDAINDDTILGLDFTHYQQNLGWGKTYYNYRQEKILNIFDFVKSQGVNTISVKIAVNPSLEQDQCYSLEESLNTLKEAEKANLKTNVVLLYSDTLTYANNQSLPEGWSSDTAEQQAIDYTTDVLTTLEDAGIIPDIITVGNEVNYNFLNFSDGENGNNAWLGWQAMGKITNVIRNFNTSIKIMIGIAEPSVPTDIEWILEKLDDEYTPVQYDYVGVNIYPTENTNQNFLIMKDTFNRIEESNGKQLIVSNVKYPGVEKTEEAEIISLVDSQTENIYNLLSATIDSSNAGGLIYDYADMVGDYNSFFDEYGIAATSLAIFAYAKGEQVDVTTWRQPFQFGVEPNLKQQTVNINKIENMSESTIRGVDVSSYVVLQNAGVKFYGFDGKEAPLMQVLKDSGVNYIRIRLWVDPTDENGNTYGGGANDTATGIKIAKDATEYGMKVMLNFQYSDFWTDPSQQILPKSWEKDKDNPEKMRENIYNYTKDTIQQFKEEIPNVDIGMVQVGNEITNGLLGEIANRDNGGKYTAVWGNEETSKKVNSYINAGSQAVRECLPEALIVLQLETPNIEKYTNIMNTWERDHVDYDVLGSSFYPFWTKDWTVEGVPNANTLSNLEKIQKLAASYGKLFVVAETAWVNDLNDSDGTHNAIGEADDTSAYEVGPQGQVDQLEDMYECLTEQPNSLGAFYWEPAWIAVKPGWVNWEYNKNMSNKFGTGWAAEAAESYCAYDKIHDSEGNGTWGGSSWDNCAMFDYNGYPLQSLLFYRDSIAKGDEQVTIIHFVDENGNKIATNDFVKIAVGDNYEYTVPKIDGYKMQGEGKVTIQGTKAGVGYQNIIFEKDTTKPVNDESNTPTKPVDPSITQPSADKGTVITPADNVIIKERFYNKVVKIKTKKYSLYDDLNGKKSNKKIKKIRTKKYVARKVYKHKNGNKYIELRTKKGKLVGYINKKAVKVLRTTQGKKYSYQKKVRITNKKYKLYSDFNWTLKNIRNYKKVYNAKYLYKHINGKKYLALYKKGKLVGYINKKATTVKK